MSLSQRPDVFGNCKFICMNAKENSLLFVYIVIDLFLLNVSMLIAYYFNLGGIQWLPEYDLQFYMLQANLAWIITYFIFTKNNIYLRDDFRHRVFRMVRNIIMFGIILMILTFIFTKDHVARQYMLAYTLVFFTFELGFYWLIYSYLNYRRSQGWYNKRVLVIGYDETANLFRKMIESTPILGYKFVGYVKPDACSINKISKENRSFLLGNTSQLEQIIKENDIHAVFSVFSFFKEEANIEEQLIVCNQMGVRMYLIGENQWWMRKSRAGDYIGPFYILNPQHIPLDELINRILKRSFDILFSLSIILCFGWNLLPMIIGIIKLTSKGPVFFVQERTGLNNIPFRCYKFRSMYLNDESDKKQATMNDVRITPFGRFMRKWDIDEFPQFFNVLRGQMSVVGPRPHMLSHTEQYSALIKYYKVRHYVKPGVTGWAQVNGWRGETDETWKMEKRVKCDMDYIENWTFFWDIKIIWLTVFGKKARANAG